jgi:hypothetical protein
MNGQPGESARGEGDAFMKIARLNPATSDTQKVGAEVDEIYVNRGLVKPSLSLMFVDFVRKSIKTGP